MEWISVKDRLPEDNAHVLVFDDMNGICVGYLSLESWNHYPIGSFAGDGCLFDVNFWMPLPNPPVPYRTVCKKEEA